MARNDVYLNINALSPADAVVTGQQDMTAATVPELVLGDTPTFNFYFTDNTATWPSWAGNASYTLTWALSDAVAGDFSPAATTGNATPITGGWSVILPLNSYDLVGLLNTKRVGQPYPVTNLWQQLRVTDPSGNEVTRAMFWTPVRYRAISDTQNTESASPTGGRFVAVNNLNALTTPTAAQFYSANPVPTSALGSAANGELLIGNGTGFTKATLTAGTGVSITNGSGSITISATDGDITLDDGTAAAPSLKFTNDTDTGLYRPAANTLGVAVGGAQIAYFDANGITIPSAGVVAGGSIHAANGNANNPSHSFSGDQDTGFFRHQPNELGIALGGTQYATLTSTTFSFTPNLSTSGNLTVSGGTIGTAASTNLTLNGGSSGASLALGQGTTGSFTFTLPSISAGNTTWVSAGAAGIGVDFKRATATATLGGTLASLNGYNGATRSTIFEFNGDGATDSGRFDWWVKPTAGSLTQAMVLKSTGNLLLGTTTDSGNGKLQLATHTTSAGGIGFGTDTSLFRVVSGNLGLYGTGTSSKITFSHSTSTANKGLDVELDTLKDAYIWLRENRVMYFGTNNTTALTLDSSQRTILAGALRLNNAYVAGAPTATGYVTIQDSAGNTYKVLVGT